MSSQTCACPLTSSAPIAERTQKLAESEAIITRRRGRRSAMTPPIRRVPTCASVQAANASPTSEAELLRPRMANATAIGARLVPKNEIVRAANSKRKFRSRRTSRGPGMGGLSPTVRPDGSEQHDPLGAAAVVLVLALALPALPVGPPDPLQVVQLDHDQHHAPDENLRPAHGSQRRRPDRCLSMGRTA